MYNWTGTKWAYRYIGNSAIINTFTGTARRRISF
jgi:hypothetical protein